MKKSVCIFPHYFTEPFLPYYVILFIKELSRHFDEIIIVTNSRPINNRYEIESESVSILFVTNEGYDFGMFFKAFHTLKISNYFQVACINDSNIIFGKLDLLFNWANNEQADFWGLADADIKPSYSTHQFNYHLQSHFMVFNKNAIPFLVQYLQKPEIPSIFNEKNVKEVKKMVINFWEIGMSQYLLSKNLIVKSFLNHKNFANGKKSLNITLDHYEKIIRMGIPIIKKKIITSLKPRDLFKIKNWKTLIKQNGDRSWHLNLLLSELKSIRNKHFVNRFSAFISK